MHFVIPNSFRNLIEKLKQVQLDKNVMELIKSAEESGDKRFLATSGRRVTFPGISEEEEYKVKLCGGYRFMEETGDVISNEKQRENRKQTIEIMAEFNRYMLKHCNVNE